MATYNTTLALKLLTDAEKDRMVITFLNNPKRNAGVDWDKCILEANSTSVASFRRGIGNSLMKLKNAQDGDDAEELATANKAPKSTPAARKAKAHQGDGDDNGDAGEGVTLRKMLKSTPAKRKRKAHAGNGEEGKPVKKKTREKNVDANSGPSVAPSPPTPPKANREEPRLPIR
ncbi:hypothetical protein B0A48_10344 [Cryoendolithus antarcticus]|uniref:Uncharacterized protein n=1 Tax=Cryoendolithus antarcticus TaxID=1507870 RepID=A0A1V8SX72_9PEZI|nr:hypothetical protein B0A48_10344 [Cryoendolithus antarcticus]